MAKIDRTLVLIKPDGVARGLIGKIITRFEDAGLKIVGLKLIQINSEFAAKHYTEDIAIRRGQHIRDQLIDLIGSAPVVAMVIDGIDAIETVRKMVGATEPKAAAPGTIRGDFAHMSFGWSDEKKFATRNIIHASSSPEDAAAEVSLWFSDSELFDFESVHDRWTR